MAWQLPFKAVVRPFKEPVVAADEPVLIDEHAPHSPDRTKLYEPDEAPSFEDVSDLGTEIDGDWTVDDIEAAYQRALETVEAAELGASETLGSPEDELTEPAESAAEGGIATTTAPKSNTAPGVSDSLVPPDETPRLQPGHIVESLLFVGGQLLTTKRLSELLGGMAPVQVEEAIENLNQEYLSEQRPYILQLEEGGWRMALLPEFERIRERVYGQGPKDVRLTQDVLEVLAYIAYQQPVVPDALEETGKKNAAALVRQLIRRELVAIHRTGPGKQEIEYRTTGRFLQLFGLRSLDDLPFAEGLVFK